MVSIVPQFVPTMVGGTLPVILFSQGSINAGSSVGTFVGTALVAGRFSGTPSWSLTANSSGTYVIAAGTGIVTITSTSKLAAETETITISVSGPKPSVANRTFQITVASTAAVVTVADPFFWLGF